MCSLFFAVFVSGKMEKSFLTCANQENETTTRMGEQKKFVVGIHIGACGTGFSFSLINDRKAKVYSYCGWTDHPDGPCNKNLNAILFDTLDETADSWGYSTRKDHLMQDSDDEDKKKVLFTFSPSDLKNLDGFLEQDGFKLPIKTIVREYLTFVKDEVMNSISRHNAYISLSEIRWIFSIPHDWEEIHVTSFKHFLLELMLFEDYIEGSHPDVLLVNELEAIAMYCIEKDSRKCLQAHRTIMIVGAEVVSVDLAILIFDEHCKLKIVGIPAVGNMLGSTVLDDEFDTILNEHFTKEKFDQFKRDQPLIYTSLLDSWNEAKSKVKDLKKPLSFNIPPKFAHRFSSSTLIDPDTLKFRLSASHVERIFRKSLDNIVSHMKEQLIETVFTLEKPVNFIFLIGSLRYAVEKQLDPQCLLGDEAQMHGTRLVLPDYHYDDVVQQGATLLGFYGTNIL